MNQHFYLNNLSISTLFEQHKNVEFLALFSLNDNKYRLDLNKVCSNVKEVKKKI